MSRRIVPTRPVRRVGRVGTDRISIGLLVLSLCGFMDVRKSLN